MIEFMQLIVYPTYRTYDIEVLNWIKHTRNEQIQRCSM